VSQRGLGVCANTSTPWEKIRLSLAHSLLSSTYFHAITHVLDLRDHNLALPCLVSYLVVSFIACVVCLVSRLVNWALLVFHRLRLLYLVLEIWKRPNSPPPLGPSILTTTLLSERVSQARWFNSLKKCTRCIYGSMCFHPLVSRKGSVHTIAAHPGAFWNHISQTELSSCRKKRLNLLPATIKTYAENQKKEQNVKSKPIQYTTILLLAIVRHMLKIKNAIIEWIICTLFLHNWPTNDW